MTNKFPENAPEGDGRSHGAWSRSRGCEDREKREREAQSPQTRGTLSRIYYDSLLIQIRYRFFSFSSTLFLHKLFCGIKTFLATTGKYVKKMHLMLNNIIVHFWMSNTAPGWF